MVKLDRFVGSCSTLNDSTFSKQNRRFKSKHAYRITGSNESKILTKEYHANVNVDLLKKMESRSMVEQC